MKTKKQTIKIMFKGREYCIWIETLTPEKAKIYLKNNYYRNRKPREKHIEMLSGFIKAQHWDLNGIPLIFDDSGTLLDGQQRCHSVIKSSTPIDTFCVSGIRTDAYIHIDQFVMRKSLADILHGNGEQQTDILSSALLCLQEYKYNKMGIRYHDAKLVDRRNLLNLLKHHPKIRETIKIAYSIYSKSPTKATGSGFASFLLYVTKNIDESSAMHFIKTLFGLSGEEDITNNPAFVIQRRIIKSKNSSQRSEKLNHRIIKGSVIKAWNAYIQGISYSSSRHILLRWDENYPTFKNQDGENIEYKDIKW